MWSKGDTVVSANINSNHEGGTQIFVCPNAGLCLKTRFKVNVKRQKHFGTAAAENNDFINCVCLCKNYL